MKADYIKKIINEYGKLPYKCILFDGPWGVGKSYTIEQALSDNNNACNISMFGMKDAQEIYHEVFFQLAMRDKHKIYDLVSKVMNVWAMISKKMDITKRLIASLVKEKELFLEISKAFNELHLIVIDDLERMNRSYEGEHRVFNVRN